MPTTAVATDTDATQGALETPSGPQRLATPPVRFSTREHEIVTFIAAGCSNQQIADCLGLRIQTVKNHLCRMYLKVGVSNRIHLAVFAVGQGIISGSSDRSATG
jgi:two-component system nitrate/nitrite response regulator NarL